jgi:anaerobic dimethyl sulfoxide reductase subunit B (iron-sulfur subunit)
MTQLGFSLNISRCSGCMACVVACMDQNDLPENGPGFRHVASIETGSYPSAEISFASISCFNCGNAPCVIVCPTGAIKRRSQDGIVQVNPDLCIGCRSCLTVCPFGAPGFLEGNKMSKCNSCLERVDHGLEPACVRICPTRALGFGPVDELISSDSWLEGELL